MTADRAIQDRDAAARRRLAAALARVAASERDALRQVYELTSAKLFGICLRICADRAAAEDVLQDVYVKVWRQSARFDAERSSPITWLSMIARNASIDWLRRAGRHAGVPQEAAAQVRDDRLHADEQLLRIEADARLHECIGTLDERQQASIRAAFLEGMSYPELADREGVPLGTMKSWIRRGLQKLRLCIGDD